MTEELTEEQKLAKYKADMAIAELGMVSTFIDVMELPKDPEFWKKLVIEELDELDAALENLLKEICDVKYVAAGAVISGIQLDPVDDSALVLRLQRASVLASYFDELAGLGYVHEAFFRVHMSNMSKLGDDGKPIRREDGKVLKGPNYAAPNLRELIELN